MSHPPAGRPFAAEIFDLDGTLLDTESLGLEAGIEALAELGHNVDAATMRGLIGLDSPTALAVLSRHLGVVLEQERTMSHWRAAMARRCRSGVPVMEGALALLDRIDALGLPRAVATNSRTQGAVSKLEASSLAGRFEVVIGFEQVARGKPAPDVFIEAARRLGIAPARCLVFEDSDVGTRAALAAGMTVVQIPDQSARGPSGAHFLARTLAEGAAWADLVPAGG
ncbi:HAD family hydrolase [Profundibacterium mesophilum]|uniref:2-deoxyglucose-6-phosphatase n=1 Tax=Profundibacterium mesophilum KAUST100406-0324 TaxID=1037889 RepID=A0A921NXM7_9RHOB|nr:HAD family phosphatase [Profundibacterium mesophilum]KAF0676614.1 2-deoxyglucose-6-phosphatase [Profundibacterium mesophilum KAUST100406-0324]